MQDTKASRMFLVAAVVVGVLATVLAFTFINNAAGADRGPQVKIVVAARDLRPNTALDADRDLSVVEVPAKFSRLAALTLDASGRGAYRGQRINRRILAGQPVFLADLGAGVGDLELKDPYRALTIAATPGIVIPGDYVKVMVSRAVPSGGAAGPGGAVAVGAGGAAYEATLVGKGEAYRVIAVGNSLSKTRQQVTAADQYENGGTNARTVTLAVTEAEAEAILRAVGPGGAPVTLLLCPPATEPAGSQP
ncbi:MAG TPA: SAF domain-containing protein [Phycisphaerae bacterium]|nr:SAF domain-containing protein [Phycisphaerae bacterium]